MSLINDMLKNLERRRDTRPAAKSNIIDDLHSFGSINAFSQPRMQYYLLSIAALVIVLLIVYLLWPAHPPTPVKIIPKTPAVSIAATKPLPSTVQPVTQPAFVLNPLAANALIPPARIQAIGITGDPVNTKFSVYLNRNTTYTANLDTTYNNLTLVLDNAQMFEPLLPINSHNTAIQDMQVANIGTQLKIMLHLTAGTTVQHVAQSENTPPQLVIDLFNPKQINNLRLGATTAPTDTALSAPTLNNVVLDNATAAAVQNAGAPQNTIEKIPEPLTAEQMADQAYQKALDLVQENRIANATAVLKRLVGQMPTYPNGREALVTLLLQQNQINSAAQIINTGLRLQPHNPAFTKLAARVLIAQGKPYDALVVMQNAAPSLTTDPNYYALMAALYQQLGEPEQAAKLYTQLVAQYPNNAIWWLGLGTSLESMGKHKKEALQAYQNAASSGNLTPDLRNFVDKRILTLGG